MRTFTIVVVTALTLIGIRAAVVWLFDTADQDDWPDQS